MSSRVTKIPVPTSVTTGAAVPVGDLGDLAIQLSGTFVATVQFQGSIDGSGAWVSIGAALTAPGIVDVTAVAKTFSQVRASVTAYTSGTPVAVVAGK